MQFRLGVFVDFVMIFSADKALKRANTLCIPRESNEVSGKKRAKVIYVFLSGGT